MDENNGKWVTIKGRHIFIKDGQSVSDAINEYETYKKAKETPEEITPMEENSTDFESLNNIYGDKEENTVESQMEVKGMTEDHTFDMSEEDKQKYEEVGNKIDALTKELEENKSYPQSVGSPSFEDMGLNVNDKKGFSEYLRDNYGTDDFRIINFENKEGAKGIYEEYQMKTYNGRDKYY